MNHLIDTDATHKSPNLEEVTGWKLYWSKIVLNILRNFISAFVLIDIVLKQEQLLNSRSPTFSRTSQKTKDALVIQWDTNYYWPGILHLSSAQIMFKAEVAQKRNYLAYLYFGPFLVFQGLSNALKNCCLASNPLLTRVDTLSSNRTCTRTVMFQREHNVDMTNQ